MARHFATRRTAGEPRSRRLRRADAREFLDELERLCRREMEDLGEFAIPGIAKLLMTTRGERRGRSPVTGEPIVIPEKRVVRARISSRIRGPLERGDRLD